MTGHHHTTPPTVFVVFADPSADREAEFNNWYDTIHGPDALANGSFTGCTGIGPPTRRSPQHRTSR
jgi:hypothetical protein